MKYRIKETVKTFEDGHQELVYNIQFKFLFWWKDLYYKIPKKIEYDTVSFEWYDGIWADCEMEAKLCLGNITEARNVLNVLNNKYNKDIDIAMWKGFLTVNENFSKN